VTLPGRTVKLRSSTASLSPYRLVNPWTSIMLSALSAVPLGSGLAGTLRSKGGQGIGRCP
jgi:hypothetical protein